MTPMVDVAFLLLIFFMVTTVFRTGTGDQSAPDDQTKVDVKQSLVLESGAARSAYLQNATDPWARTPLDALDKVFGPWKE
jgi:biopolymer transport protein ExbD